MKQILFPVDFSPSCEALAPYVAGLARQFNARVTLLHVMATGSLEGDFERFAHHFGTLSEEVQGLLERWQTPVFAGLDVDREFKTGRPVAEIVACAEGLGAELIALPTHGLGRFRTLLLGSVTAGVLHDTASAVLTAVHAETPGTLRLPRVVVCATDLGPGSAATLDMADHFALHCGAKLHVIHVVNGPLWELQEEEALDKYPEIARSAEVKEKIEIIRAVPVREAVLGAVERYQGDLLVAGRGRRVEELIRRSPCPVVSV